MLRFLSMSAAAVGVLATSAFCETRPAPVGEVVLTISGDIAHETADNTVMLDMAMLENMPVQEFATSSVWIEGKSDFTGVSLRKVLDYAGVTGGVIEAVALNDYKVDIPVDEIGEDYPIIAYRLNGETMSRRGKGPLWIVYPYDLNEDFRTEVSYSRSIWQLDRIVSKD